ncbi:right-handed parallel beta-helix repeat-containing protein [Negadavirga shengliensis]|uniref:Right-handed parallel beta-helix repeat-containing protein n=1 Tax=Negadavirga shengliensis TaxID=1389218 RepID=A0ABV9T4U0_9BACT
MKQPNVSALNITMYFHFHFHLICKVLLSLVFWATFTTTASSATYYFSDREGDDSRSAIEARNPETPWKTLDKLNSILVNLGGGDTVLLKSNEVFDGMLILKGGGTLTRPIVISSYGSGEPPIVSGWTTLSKWTHVGNGIYCNKLDELKHKTHLLIINGKIHELGRFPNEDYIEYEAISENEINPLSSSLGHEWKNASIAIRKNEWVIDTHQIISLENNKITYKADNSYFPSNGYGFFLQDHIKTLDRFGEWFHDEKDGKIFVYFGDKAPNSYDIKVSSQNNLLINTPKTRNIKIEKIKFSGSNKTSIQLIEAENIEIKNCSIDFSGENAITAMTVPNIKITNNQIDNILNSGIYLRYGVPNANVSYNNIQNVHLFHGMGQNGDGNGMGIFCRSDGGIIYRNKLKNIGYSGITFNGNNVEVSENIVKNFCLVKNDGGGIYTFEGKQNKNYSQRIISNNIILNGIGTRLGNRYSSKLTHPQADGIYIDDNASNILIKGNTVFNVSRSSINLHNARNISIIDNLVINGTNQLNASHDQLADPVRNIHIEGNRFCALSEYQKILKISSIKDDIPDMVKLKNNMYVYPENQDHIFEINYRQKPTKTRNYNTQNWKYSGLKDENHSVFRMPTSPALNSLKSYKKTLDNNHLFKIASCLNDECKIEKISTANNNIINFNTTGYLSGIKMDIGKIDPNKSYLLKFHASSKTPTTLNIYLRHTGHPWQMISRTQILSVQSTLSPYEEMFVFPENADNGSILIKTEEPVDNLALQDLEWGEIEINETQPDFLFDYNESDREKELILSSEWYDTQGNIISGKIVMKPYSSIILFSPKP